MSGRHKWKQDQTWGVTAGSGRPHGVIETWTCCRCGAQKMRAPRSTHTGARVLRWTYRGPDGETVERMGSCLGYHKNAEPEQTPAPQPCASIHCRHWGLASGVPCVIEAHREHQRHQMAVHAEQERTARRAKVAAAFMQQ